MKKIKRQLKKIYEAIISIIIFKDPCDPFPGNDNDDEVLND